MLLTLAQLNFKRSIASLRVIQYLLLRTSGQKPFRLTKKNIREQQI